MSDSCGDVSGSIKEGYVVISPLVTPGDKVPDPNHDKSGEVFYNPSQVFNRDISELVVSAYHEMCCEDKPSSSVKLRVLELLGASGIRACRYAKELDDIVSEVVCNDLDITAVEHIMQNAKANGVSEKIYATCGDANELAQGGNSYLLSNLSQQKDPRVIASIRSWAQDRLDSTDATPPLRLMDYPFDVVDVDPYGSGVSFLESAVKRVSNGGLLCLTCTDMQVLTAGNYPDTVFSKYGGIQLTKMSAPWIHEMSLRLLMNTVNSTCSRYGKVATPLMCLSVDFYVRIFVQVRRSPASAKFAGLRTAVGLLCHQCQNTSFLTFGKLINQQKSTDTSTPADSTLPLPALGHTNHLDINILRDSLDHKGSPRLISKSAPEIFGKALKFKTPRVDQLSFNDERCNLCGTKRPYLFGPFYQGPLFDANFVNRVIRLAEQCGQNITMGVRIRGMLTAMAEELHDIPLYYSVVRLCSTFKIPTVPGIQVRRALEHCGYRTSQHHRDPGALKTDAPLSVLHDIIRVWIKDKKDALEDKRPLHDFLTKEVTTDGLEGCFEGPIKSDQKKRRVAGIPKWSMNPGPNWGPMQRAKKVKTTELEPEGEGDGAERKD
eukprot:GHVH01010982.1.p1 GENE.GHVH01010982.1~~GHVH01010982.1.p1  ORF type:complete len:617 (+),score=73.75 GHVH01010982.1:39-1853(+)